MRPRAVRVCSRAHRRCNLVPRKSSTANSGVQSRVRALMTNASVVVLVQYRVLRRYDGPARAIARRPEGVRPCAVRHPGKDLRRASHSGRRVLREESASCRAVNQNSACDWSRMPLMKHFTCLLIVAIACVSDAFAQRVTRDLPYATVHERQVLDVYAPDGAKNLPVVFWIHGGGWQAGNKSMVGVKPKAFTEAGFVFVSISYRLLPTVDMTALTSDVATALGWVHKNIATYGGDPARLFVMGHSAGGQLAALMCTDEKYVNAQGFPLTTIKGCVPVDADTFDIPAIIEVAETRARAHHLPLPTNGHRQKFGNDPAKHLDFSAVTHVAANKGIPPFLILHIAGNPDTSAQARRLADVLHAVGVSAKVVGRDNTHEGLNDEIGVPNDPVTKEVFAFVADALKR